MSIEQQISNIKNEILDKADLIAVSKDQNHTRNKASI